MKFIHPFPARMAPEIVLQKLSNLNKDKIVLDPMVGSGMVLNAASRLGLKSFGVDLDPLAVLISRVCSTKIDIEKSRNVLRGLIEKAKTVKYQDIVLPWIDNNDETVKFIDYWFDKKQISQMRALSYCLVQNPICSNGNILNILKVSISRLIITKEPRISLARDTAHSRPHKTIETNNYDIFENLPKSLEEVLKALKPEEIVDNSKIFLSDARKLDKFSDSQFDVIITSPPYLNAIDYMRGHKFSLIWFGYSISDLKKIRSNSIGVEKGIDVSMCKEFISGLCDIAISDSPMILRYFIDLYKQLNESYRVLKPKGQATFVIGNSLLKDRPIYNNELLKRAAINAGFIFLSEESRGIPASRRYLPISGLSDLSKRMKKEFILTFTKTKKPPHAKNVFQSNEVP
jgi:DNA modification methylase